MMRLLLFSFLILLFDVVALSQNCDGFEKTNSSSKEYIEIVASKSFDKKNEEHIQRAKDVLKKDLQLLMSETILTEVKGETKHLITESNGEFSEFFQSQMKIETSTSLGFASVDFCEDRDAKLVWGRYRINRIELAAATLQNCISKMTAINAEIQGIVYSDSKVDIHSVKQKYLNVYRDFSSAIYLNPSLDTEKWQLLIQTYNREISRLSHSQDQIEFENEFEVAKGKLKSGLYSDALIILNRLKVDHFKNEELNKVIENAVSDYEIHVKRKVGEQRNQRDFSGALSTIAGFCGIVTCDESIIKLREEISKLYMHDEAEKLRLAIKYDEPLNVEIHKRNIDKYQDFDRELYNEICFEYNEFHIKLGMRQVLTNKAKEDYWTAYGVIKDLENKYGKRDNELMKLKGQIERKILKDEVRTEKNTRPKLMSIWLGSDVVFNEAELGGLMQYKMSQYLFTYNVGFYFKYRFEENYRKSYPVRSDFIGMKFRVIDYGSSAIVPGSELLDLSSQKSRRANFDLGIDGIAFRVLHYGLSTNLDRSQDLMTPNYYQATIGLRIPLSIFSWITDVNLKTSLQGRGLINLSSGLAFRLDYARKFSRKDKLKIRAEKFG